MISRHFSRRRALQAGAVAVGGVAAGSMSQASAAPPANPSVYGPASLSIQVSATNVSGDTAYLSTRGLSPLRLVGYDFNTRSVTSVSFLPLAEVDGSYGVEPSPDGSQVYLATYTRVGRLFAWDAASHEFTLLSDQLGNLPFSADTAPDGKIYIGMYGTLGQGGAKVWEYDPATAILRDLGSAVDTATSLYARWVSVDETHVYVGTTRDGVLVRRPRGEGEWTEVHRIPKVGNVVNGYNGLTVGADKIFAIQSGGVVRMDLDGGNPRLIAGLGSALKVPVWDAATSALYVTDYAGAILRLRDDSSTLEVLARNSTGTMHNGFGVISGGRLGGSTEDGIMWDLNLATGEYVERDLIDLAPEAAGGDLVHSISAGTSRSIAWVGGRNAITRHDVSAGTTRRISVAGEVKAAGVSGGEVIAAIYPSTEVVAVDETTGAVRTFGRIGTGQYRPMDLEVEPATGRVFIATKQNLGVADGALTVLHPDRPAERQTLVGVLPGQAVVSVDLDAGKCFLAGDRSGGAESVPAGAPPCEVAVLDVKTLEVVSRFAPSTGTALMSVAHLDGIVYGVYKVPAGQWFAWDLARGVVVGGSLAGGGIAPLPGYGELVRHADKMYACVLAESNQDVHVYRLGPGPARLVAQDLGRSWYTYPQLAFSGAGMHAWTLSNRNLARLSVRP